MKTWFLKTHRPHFWLERDYAADICTVFLFPNGDWMVGRAMALLFV
jgi:hypothetical protein